MEEDGDDLSHLLSNCEKGLPPVGFESVDDVAMQRHCSIVIILAMRGMDFTQSLFSA